MSSLSVEDYLQALSEDQPCGEDLEYDPDFIALDTSAQEKGVPMVGEDNPADGVDWAAVRRQAKALLTRTRDLRVALLLTRAELNQNGLSGFRDGLQIIHGFLDRFWDQVHPQLDPSDGLDPTQRINILEALNDPQGFLGELERAALIRSRNFGPVSLRDILEAGRASTEGDDAPAGRLDKREINAAFMDCELEVLRHARDAAVQSKEAISGVESAVASQVESGQQASLKSIDGHLTRVLSVLEHKLSERGEQSGEVIDGDDFEIDQDESEPADGEPGGRTIKAQINSREDVLRALELVCDYYDRNEPSSPVPIFLKRARNLVTKDFMQILEDLLPDAVNQAERFSGPRGEDG